MGQLIDQPKLSHILHPGSDQRNKLSRDEKLKITVLHGAEARGRGRADRCAVALQNIFPPLVGCRRRELFTMPREERCCQRGCKKSHSACECQIGFVVRSMLRLVCQTRAHWKSSGLGPVLFRSSDCRMSGVELRTLLLARRIGRTNMHVAQIPECGLVLFTHPPGKIRVIQPLIPCELRHILQHAQSLPNRLSPVRRHLPPLRHYVVPDMVLLLRRQSVPNCLPTLQFLPLRWRKILVPVVVLEDPLLFLRRQVAEFSRRRRVRGRRTVRIVVGIEARTRNEIRPVRTVSRRIAPPAVRPVPLLRWFRRIPRRLVLLRRLLRSRLRFRWRMLLRRPMGYTAVLGRRRAGQRCAEPYRQQTSCELESKSHPLHRLILIVVLLLILVLIRIAVARIIGLYRLGQIRQCSKI